MVQKCKKPRDGGFLRLYAGGMREFAEEPSDVEIAFADTAGFALPRRLVVARTDTDPGRQSISAAEGSHIAADFHQQHGRADQIDAGQGLQQGKRIAFTGQPFEQARIEAGDARFDLFDMPHQFAQDEAMTRGQFTLQGVKQFFTAGFEPLAGQFQYFLWWPIGNDGLDHGACRLAMQVADHDAEANAAVGKHLVQAIFLGGQKPDQLLPLARDQAQLAHHGWWDERPA